MKKDKNKKVKFRNGITIEHGRGFTKEDAEALLHPEPIKRMTLDEKRAAVGSRLRECIDAAHMKQAALLSITEERFGKEYRLSAPHLSEVLRGKRSLSQDVAIKYADILGIDPGYLTGADDFTASSYSEYVEKQTDLRQFLTSTQSFSRFDYILNPIGYKVRTYIESNDKPESYTFDFKNIEISIPAEEMDSFLEEVHSFIKMRFEWMLYKHGDLWQLWNGALYEQGDKARRELMKNMLESNKEQ